MFPAAHKQLNDQINFKWTLFDRMDKNIPRYLQIILNVYVCMMSPAFIRLKNGKAIPNISYYYF